MSTTSPTLPRRSKRKNLSATPENLSNISDDAAAAAAAAATTTGVITREEVPPNISEQRNLLDVLAERRAQLASAVPAEPDDRRPIVRVGATFLDRSNNTTYTFIAKLGAGTSGNVFTASVDGSNMPAVTVKRFFIRDYVDVANRNYNAEHLEEVYRDGRMLLEEAARKEFAISRVIRRRSDNELCEEDIVCALHIFKVSRNEFCITFPFYNALDLDRYMRDFLYVDAGRVATSPERRSYVERCFVIIIDLLEIMAKLAAIKVLHSDVKPANILVTTPRGKLRLIDFGIGANLLDVLDPSDATNVQAIYSRATQRYDTTRPYKDPASAYIVLTPENEEKMYEAFTVFACGIIVQQLFDTAWNYERPPPYVRETPLMPEGVWALIQQMTRANVKDRLSLASYAYRFQILKRKYARAHAIAAAATTTATQQQAQQTPTPT